MSIPLDRLYNFLHDISGHDISIYRFYPHGSKNLLDLLPLKKPVPDVIALLTPIIMICHDQEPLNYDLYKDAVPESPPTWKQNNWIDAISLRQSLYPGLKSVVLLSGINLNDYCFLLHSEKNSEHVKLYEQEKYISVYYWSHAIIARDWFRYADLDPCVKTKQTWPDIDFLIYNRSWSGTREYRIKFAELLVDNDLAAKCLTKFNPIDGEHYNKHNFSNVDFKPIRTDLECYFDKNISESSASADYNYCDYQQTAIEVVLETLFDDSRLHLTEKTLRPIACGQPFILAATPGSLKYIRDYGFKTFEPYIDENYDTIQDPVTRMKAIMAEMKRISLLAIEEKQILIQQLQEITEYNRHRFFSDDFFQFVVDEYQANLRKALDTLRPLRKGENWKTLRECLYQNYGISSFYQDSQSNSIPFTPESSRRILDWLHNLPPI